jgi:spore coat protein U-like protein
MRHVIAAVAALLVAVPAWAGNCGFDSVTQVSFGLLDPFSPDPLDAIGELRVICHGMNRFDRFSVTLSRGASPTYTPRTMVNGARTVRYNLYLDSGRQTVWGDGVSQGTSVAGPFSPASEVVVSLKIYGRVFPGQTGVGAGTYTDVIVATISY